jgi:hypothetical protein
VAGPDPPPGAIAGLAEVGVESDAPLIRALLTHPAGAVCAHAVRALNQLGTVPVEQTLGMLRHPTPAVVREASAALRLAAPRSAGRRCVGSTPARCAASADRA